MNALWSISIILASAILGILLSAHGRRREASILITLSLATSLAISLFSWTSYSILTFSFDDFSRLFFLIFLSVSLASSILALLDDYPPEFFVLLSTSTLGLVLLSASQDLITMLVSLELAMIPCYALAAISRDRDGIEAAIKFFIAGAISTILASLGIALIYGSTGTVFLRELGEILDKSLSSTLILGLIFLISGLGVKIAAVPFHLWVPDVYQGSPNLVTAYLAGAEKLAGFLFLIRALIAPMVIMRSSIGLTLAILSILTMTLGNVVALVQRNVKRMLAYSSIAHSGYLMIGLATYSVFGLAALIFYALIYALMKAGAFLASGVISRIAGGDDLEKFSGIRHRAPLTSLSMALFLLSLAGIPPLAGFIGKVLLFGSALVRDMLWLAIIAVINSVIALYYYARVIRYMYFPSGEGEGIPEENTIQAALLIFLALMLIVLGIYPYPLYDYASKIALALMMGG